MNATADVPAHVPPHLVRDFSFWTSPGMQPMPNGDPHGAARLVRDMPRVFWAAKNTFDGRGCWMLTHAEDMRAVLQDAATFSSNRQFFSPLVKENWPLVPLEIDPPEHTKFRALLNPLFAPKRMNAMQAGIRERCVEMIEALRPRGSIDFMNDFAFPFAVGVFLQFIGLDATRLREFVKWGMDVLHAPEKRERVTAAHSIMSFLMDLFERRRREPADDIGTFLVQAQIDGRPLTEDELKGFGALIFIGGLDTVASALGFDFRYLAVNQDAQRRLRDNPALIPEAVEEMLRAFPTVHMVRVATRDTEIQGIKIKAGDRVTCSSVIANRDPLEFPDPDAIDFKRQVNRHVAFSYGPHRCVGSHLARRELIVALQEWLPRVPQWRIREGTAPIAHAGLVLGIHDLVLAWD
jgi:cytochrome P450